MSPALPASAGSGHNSGCMHFNLCPRCYRVNDEHLAACESCGTVLNDGDTVPSALQVDRESAPSGALWLDDLSMPDLPPLPEPESPPVDDDQPLAITLRELEFPPIDDLPPVTEPPPAEIVADAVQPPVLTVVVELPPAVEPPPFVDTPVAVDLAAHDAALSARRNARRASVRRSRLRTISAAARNDEVREVLIVDADDAARIQLGGLLLGFGFGVHSVADAARATALLEGHQFVAAFVDVALDDSDGGVGVDLCRHIKASGPSTLLVVASRGLTAVDRVRAKLAGCDDVLAKPMTRGSVASVLDLHDIVLPADPRRI